ncbi:Histone methylation protein [Phytophthora megakarya]|uniref:Histone-lysine N-methyltransferase, H3 lysine-79 specific n=1 Tax=Phytophthora megakarya TaxID=4795 RepID=A0A225VYL2_9STRA|nr:Histone methylation protein [Phytophthora megakarya]
MCICIADVGGERSSEEASQAYTGFAGIASIDNTAGRNVTTTWSDSNTGERSVSTTLPVVQGLNAIVSIFGSVRASEVRQQAGRTHCNAGESLPLGVAAVIDAFSGLGTDVFLDVGAGIGNILAQVALTTNAKACIGVEIREDLCGVGHRCFQRHTSQYPQLVNVNRRCMDVRDAAMSSQLPTRDATAIFADTFFFEESAKLVIARELGAMAKARTVASTSSVYPRHRASCSQPFCQTWKLKSYVMVSCSWKAALHPVYLYHRI